MSDGALITFEGIDGSGKTTQAHLLWSRIASAGRETWLTKEPTDGPFGKLIRDGFGFDKNERLHFPDGNPEHDQVLMAYVFAADRYLHQTELRYKLNKGMIVVCDRYLYSSLAYQRMTGEKWLRDVNRFAIEPDYIVFMYVSMEVIFERLRKRGDVLTATDETRLKTVQDNYDNVLSVLPSSKVIKVFFDDDAKKTHENVWSEIVKRIQL